VLIQVIHYRWDNGYLADVLKRYPGKFQGVCRVDPEDAAAPDTLSELTAQGFRGVRLSPAANASGDWIGGPLMKPLWRRCGELKVPMTLLIPASRLPQVVPLLESNPELTVVIDHMADCPLDRPDLLAGLLAFARYPKVFVKISHLWSLSKQAYPYRDSLEQVKKLRDSFGAARLMWGTDWPIATEMLDYSQRVKLYDEHLSFLNRDEQMDVMYRTVQRVWPFGLS
jgi:predicted TIM-barrel fold metal-dependent hydrolase